MIFSSASSLDRGPLKKHPFRKKPQKNSIFGRIKVKLIHYGITVSVLRFLTRKSAPFCLSVCREDWYTWTNLSPEEEFFIQFHFRRSILTLKFNFDPALKADTECARHYPCFLMGRLYIEISIWILLVASFTFSFGDFGKCRKNL